MPRSSIRSVTHSFSTARLRIFQKGCKNVLQTTHFSTTTFMHQDSQGLASSKFGVSESLQSQIVNALHLGQREKATKFLSSVSHGNNPLRADDFVQILDYCARSPDPLFGLETWRIMEEKEIVLNRRCYMLVLQALTNAGYFEEALNWLSFLGQNSHSAPDLDMYNKFLTGCARMGSTVHVNACLELMENQMVGKSETTYMALLKLSVLQKNLSGVQGIWKEFIKYYSLSFVCLHNFIKSFTTLGDLHSAYAAMQLAVALALKGHDGSDRRKGMLQSSKLDIPIPATDDFSFRSPFASGLTRAVEGDLREKNVDVFSAKSETPVVVGTGILAPMPNADWDSDLGVLSRILGSDITGVLKGCVASPRAIKFLSTEFSNVMYACAKAKNFEVAEKLFRQMEKLGLEPSEDCYSYLVSTIVYRKGVADGFALMNEMVEKDVKPCGRTLATMSVGCSKILEMDTATALVDAIGETPPVGAFNALLAACNAKTLSVLGEICSHSHSRRAKKWGWYLVFENLRGFVNKGPPEIKVFSGSKEREGKGLQVGSERCFKDVLKGANIKTMVCLEKSRLLLKKWERSVVIEVIGTCDSWDAVAMRSGEVLKLDFGTRIRSFGGNKGMFFVDTMEKVEMIVNNGSIEGVNFSINLYAWSPEVNSIPAEWFKKCERWVYNYILGLPYHLWSVTNFEKLGNLLGETIEIDPCNAALENIEAVRLKVLLEADQDQPERAVQLLAKMKQLNLKFDIKTYELLFSLFGTVRGPYEKGTSASRRITLNRINNIELDMGNNGVQHSFSSMLIVLKCLGAEGMVKEQFEYIRMPGTQVFLSNHSQGTKIFNVLLHTLVEARKSDTALQVFKDMKLRELQPDAATYSIMMDCCSQPRFLKSGYAFLSMMLRHGFPLQPSHYTPLIKIVLADGGFDKALDLLDDMDTEGVERDVVLYNSILYIASRKSRIDIIEYIVERMHREEIQPDPTTLATVMNAYVRRQHHTTALEAVQVLSMRMISLDDSVLEKNRQSFVENYEKEMVESVVDIFKCSEENKFTAFCCLRWSSVLLGDENILLEPWAPNKTEWAQRLSSDYGLIQGKVPKGKEFRTPLYGPKFAKARAAFTREKRRAFFKKAIAKKTRWLKRANSEEQAVHRQKFLLVLKEGLKSEKVRFTERRLREVGLERECYESVSYTFNPDTEKRRKKKIEKCVDKLLGYNNSSEILVSLEHKRSRKTKMGKRKKRKELVALLDSAL